MLWLVFKKSITSSEFLIRKGSLTGEHLSLACRKKATGFCQVSFSDTITLREMPILGVFVLNRTIRWSLLLFPMLFLSFSRLNFLFCTLFFIPPLTPWQEIKGRRGNICERKFYLFIRSNEYAKKNDRMRVKVLNK